MADCQDIQMKTKHILTWNAVYIGVKKRIMEKRKAGTEAQQYAVKTMKQAK
jgi:hypothetical protein